jgi:seryl-tRNA synthetase
VLDIVRVRENPEGLKRALTRRGADYAPVVDELVQLDQARRAAVTEVNEIKARRNVVSKEVGERKRRGEDADALVAEGKAIGARITELDQTVAKADARIQEILLGTPNTPLDEVPVGDESANRVVKSWGERRDFSFQPLAHWDLGERLGILDLARGARVSGSGFPVLRGAGARLQRVLIDFFLDVHTTRHRYQEVRVPYLVTSETLTGTGQLPKFEDDLYRLERDNLWLIPTAEVPVTNLHREELLPAAALPVRYTSYTPCFRREAGAAGKDTQGIFRVHQFDKVEMFAFVEPEESRDEHERLLAVEEEILGALGIPYRVVNIAANDLGASAAKKYDLEAWLPGQERFRELTSCSNTTDFQARRLDIRYRPAEGQAPRHVHTLNGTAVAVGRTIIAIVENHQRDDGTVAIPEVLHPFGAPATIRAA